MQNWVVTRRNRKTGRSLIGGPSGPDGLGSMRRPIHLLAERPKNADILETVCPFPGYWYTLSPRQIIPGTLYPQVRIIPGTLYPGTLYPQVHFIPKYILSRYILSPVHFIPRYRLSRYILSPVHFIPRYTLSPGTLYRQYTLSPGTLYH